MEECLWCLHLHFINVSPLIICPQSLKAEVIIRSRNKHVICSWYGSAI